MNIPNILTVIRFVLIPIFGYYLYIESYLVATILFLVAGLTDILDGYIARRFNMVTSWGKLADPAADKLMQITALVLLTIRVKTLIPVLVIVIAKEVFMGLGSILLYRKDNVVVSANWYGKLATVIFYLAIVMIFIFRMEKLQNRYTDLLIFLFVGIAVLSTLFAFFMYSREFRKFRNSNRQ